MLVFLTADVQAQLIYKTKFSAVEGYTNGWVIGQPSVGNKWSNANNDWDWVNANNPAYNNMNDGKSWWPEGATEPWYIASVTNCTAPGGGAMKIASDNNWGTNIGTYFFKMDFSTQLKGPITVTWDRSSFPRMRFRLIIMCTLIITARHCPATTTVSPSPTGKIDGRTGIRIGFTTNYAPHSAWAGFRTLVITLLALVAAPVTGTIMDRNSRIIKCST